MTPMCLVQEREAPKEKKRKQAEATGALPAADETDDESGSDGAGVDMQVTV